MLHANEVLTKCLQFNIAAAAATETERNALLIEIMQSKVTEHKNHFYKFDEDCRKRPDFGSLFF